MARFKFRAWHTKTKSMLENRDQGYEGNVFLWANEGQPVEIMQFTGLKDKAGADIYEGDILDSTKYPEDDPCPYAVVFEHGAFRKRYAEWEDDLKKPVLDEQDVALLDDVVIGNIYQNPELLGSV